MHFFAAVVIPSADRDVAGAVEAALAPYCQYDGENHDGWWDWFQLGGRWTGTWDETYDPATDPANVEVCDLCAGTGTRPDGAELFGAEWVASTNGCNGCHGEGTRLKWPTDWATCAGDVITVREALSRELAMPYTVVTPEGAWHRETWDGEGFTDVPEFHRLFREALSDYPDGLVAVVDYHS